MAGWWQLAGLLAQSGIAVPGVQNEMTGKVRMGQGDWNSLHPFQT